MKCSKNCSQNIFKLLLQFACLQFLYPCPTVLCSKVNYFFSCALTNFFPFQFSFAFATILPTQLLHTHTHTLPHCANTQSNCFCAFFLFANVFSRLSPPTTWALGSCKLIKMDKGNFHHWKSTWKMCVFPKIAPCTNCNFNIPKKKK